MKKDQINYLKRACRAANRVLLVLGGYLLLNILIPVSTLSQYILDEKVSFVYVKGTSTLHDWTTMAEKMKGSLQGEVKADHIVKISSAKISIPVSSLKSGKEGMDKNMKKALKADNYPEISYQLKSSTVHNGSISVKGELTIAGVTKTVETKVTQKEAGKHISVEGEIKLKMSSFNIKPPEFLLGSFKTGDEISITFYFMFCDNN
jgi:polyisoprenoid-binding protein YceI